MKEAAGELMDLDTFLLIQALVDIATEPLSIPAPDDAALYYAGRSGKMANTAVKALVRYKDGAISVALRERGLIGFDANDKHIAA